MTLATLVCVFFPPSIRGTETVGSQGFLWVTRGMCGTDSPFGGVYLWDMRGYCGTCIPLVGVSVGQLRVTVGQEGLLWDGCRWVRRLGL
jgi:hypothetical protein